MKTKKILVITACADCCFCIFDAPNKTERLGKPWCAFANKQTNASGIPKFCPLPAAYRNVKTSADLLKEFKESFPRS